MSFGKDESVAQPPTVDDAIFFHVPSAQYRAMQRKQIELENSLRAIRNFIFSERKRYIAEGKPLDVEPTVESLPILTEIQRILPDE